MTLRLGMNSKGARRKLSVKPSARSIAPGRISAVRQHLAAAWTDARKHYPQAERFPALRANATLGEPSRLNRLARCP
eukprot:CAMPEP_0170401666 /NCGR_PEP_ID=MMETSP0117_2-20130122/25143_1 /TAXON_ID=400756 /ORGANISM="Durinskia baltica, Strain CSIRO CS-38" /LENGTH=76 /DNA_ID=CAMNT_0010658477 /DNA_START=37 /DNA_END=264 /DNA_ORIENTATION=+